MLTKVLAQPEGVLFLSRVVSGQLNKPLLLVGPDGVGKRRAVLEAAEEVFGSESYAAIERGVHPDVITVSPEGSSDIHIDVIRELVELAQTRPSVGPQRWVIVDGADKLGKAAANAFLKTLEENTTTRFFLLAERAKGVLPTIRSRCGQVRFNSLPSETVKQILLEQQVDGEKAALYSALGAGSAGRALQFYVSGRIAVRQKLIRVLNQWIDGDVSGFVSEIDQVEPLDIGLEILERILQDLLLMRSGSVPKVNTDISQELLLLMKRMTAEQLVDLSSSVQKILSYPSSVNSSFHLKAALL